MEPASAPKIHFGLFDFLGVNHLVKNHCINFLNYGNSMCNENSLYTKMII